MTPSPRSTALFLLRDVLKSKRPLDEVLENAGRDLSSRDRAFARMLTATTLRRLGQIDALIGLCLESPLPTKAAVARDILRLGACQILFMDTPAHAAVDTAVDLAQDTRQGPYKKLINAVLRRLSREGEDMIGLQDSERLNTPDWLWQSWQKAYGEETARLMAKAHLVEAPLDFSVKSGPEIWAEKLEAQVLPTGTLRRAAGGRIEDLPGFEEGAWWVQDAAAALPAKLLGDVRGKRVLDLCAAPGGKTAQLASAGAHVTALDRSEKRLQRLTANMTRLGLNVETLVADASIWQPPRPFDAVLLDAPCSATGTIRRHPDVPYLKGPADTAKLAQLQKKLLQAATGMVIEGGLVVYCVCSLQPEEGEAQVAAFANLERVPVAAEEIGGLSQCLTPEGDVRVLPHHMEGGLDGFFISRLRKTS